MSSLLFSVLLAAASPKANNTAKSSAASATELAKLNKLFAKPPVTDISADLSVLPASERAALKKIVSAAELMDGIFLRQVSAFNPLWLSQTASDSSALGKARLHAFLLMKGPWDRLDQNAPFIPNAGPMPGGLNFYPADSSRQEIDNWITSLQGKESSDAKSFYTVIRRNAAGKLISVPYNVEYRQELIAAAKLLQDAANLTEEASLKKFLELRAAAFLSNDYHDSDEAWLDNTSAIEPTIGPFDPTLDEWFGKKAAFWAIISVRDAVDSDNVQKYADSLQDIADHYPVDAKYKHKVTAVSPISVVNEVFDAGSANDCTHFAAYTMPADEHILADRGSKQILIKNMQAAKFKAVLVPIAAQTLSPADQKRVTFSAFFTHFLMEVLVTNVQPVTIVKKGVTVTVRDQLKELTLPMTEASDRTAALFAIKYLIDQGKIRKSLENSIYQTFLVSLLRQLRFGTSSTDALSSAWVLNAFLDSGAFKLDAAGIFSIEPSLVRSTVATIVNEATKIIEEGDYEAASALMKNKGAIRPDVKKVLDKFGNVPVDIEAKFADLGG